MREISEMPQSPADQSLIYYGPHSCAECGGRIVVAARDQGAVAYDAPDEPIYPNTQWAPHIHAPLSPEAVTQ